jgi:hypothetical protein
MTPVTDATTATREANDALAIADQEDAPEKRLARESREGSSSGDKQ